MRLKLGVFFLVLAGLVAFLVGCQSDPEEKRAVITVSSINDNQPYFSDVISQGDSVYDRSGTPVTWDDYVDEDWVNVTFYNKPYNPFNTAEPGTPFGDYIVTRYMIEWERVDGGTEKPDTYNGATSIILPSGEFTTGGILLVPFYEKNKPYLQEINYLGPRMGQEVLCIAHITFWGHEIGTDRETLFKASLSVNFGDLIIASRPQGQ